MPFPAINPTVPALLRTSSERYGDRVFLAVDGADLTYRELERRSATLACTLLAEGISKGDHVGILMPNSVDWAIAWFATTRIGAVAVPINTFYKVHELAWTVRHADLRAVLAWSRFRTNDYLTRLEEALPGLSEQSTPGDLRVAAAPCLRTIAIWGESDRPWSSRVSDETSPRARERPVPTSLLVEVEQCVTPADRCFIVYTSGSTGEPKAPIHTQGTLIRHSYNLTHVYLVAEDDVMFSSMPFFWVGGLITALHAVIHHGATLVTQPAFEPSQALALIERHRATITLGWPQQGKTLADHPEFAERDLSSVRRTSMPAMVPSDRRPAPTGSDSLGMTELSGNHLGADPYVAQPEHRRGTFGPSVDGLTHRITDPDTGAALPAGERGEIWVRGYSLMQGLYKREREDVFTPDGFYRTGDAGHLDDDGWAFFTGRLGDMIKTAGGTNVTPSEVEAALLGDPDVSEAYVVGALDADNGTVVTAAVVPRAAAQVDGEALRRRLRDQLSAYKIPKIIAVLPKQGLPFTDTGKIKKHVLAEQLGELLSAHQTTR